MTSAEREAVQRQLERIVDSPLFHSSRRGQSCLRYIVQNTLEGHTDRLKERCLGTEIFGRDPNYDTGADSIVRVAVNELRKKLAQYYLHAEAGQEVVIELPAGSYVPEFRWGSAAAATEVPRAPVARRRSRLIWAIPVLGVAALLLASWLVTRRAAPVDTDAQFWQPALSSTQPALLCIGNPVVYLLSSKIHAQYRKEHPEETTPGTYVIRLGDMKVDARDIVPSVNQFVGAGDAYAMATLGSTLTRLGKAFEFRPGNEVSFSDTRRQPVVFVGFTNRLHLEMTRGLRFAFAVEDGVKMIRDQPLPERSYRLPNIAPDGRTDYDFALISRIIHSESGLPLVQVAGITNYGTRAAAEFLSNPAQVRQAMQLMPPGWKGNVQIVLKTRVIAGTPTPAKVLAVHTW